MQDFRNLDVWHKAHAVSIDVHKTLVKHRRVDAHMRSQMSRASQGIPAALVEGCGKDSQAELARYADISIGSCSELEYWVLAAKDLGYFPPFDFDRLTASTLEIRRMLFGLRRAVRGGGKSKPVELNSSPPA